MIRLAFLALVVAACGSSGPTTAPVGRAIALAQPPATPDDIQVATVNGRPVWGSCVTRQAQALSEREPGSREVNRKSRDAALRECIDVELLAQIAEQRHLDQDPDVQEALRTALVDRIVTTGYEEKFRTAADFGAAMQKSLADNDRRRHRPEFRGSTYLRVRPDVQADDKKMAMTDPREPIAKAIAEKIGAAVANQPGLSPAHLADIAAPLQAEATAAKLTIEQTDIVPYALAGLDTAYASILFSLPEIGRAGGPVRTPWGYDVILWTNIVEPQEQTREQLADELLPLMRREYFAVWVKDIEKTLGAKVTYFDDNLSLLGEKQ